MYGEGISKPSSLLDLGVELEIVSKSGSWFSYGTERIGQGRDSALEYIRQHPAMAADLGDQDPRGTAR